MVINKMKNIKIIGICIASVFVIILASSSNVIGYQTVQSTNLNKNPFRLPGASRKTFSRGPGPDRDVGSFLYAGFYFAYGWRYPQYLF